MQTAVGRKTEIGELERSWVTKMKHLADMYLGLPQKAQKEKSDGD